MPSVGPVSEMNLSVNDIATFARVCTTPLDKSVCRPLVEYSPEQYEKNFKLVKSLYKKGHLSVFEHSQMTFLVTCSRACSLQLARHRHISRTEMSQRYTIIGGENNEWFVTPPECEDSRHFSEQMKDVASIYNSLINLGYPREDARFVLPEATKTRMFITLNLRTLIELRNKRMNNPGAQWEIRELVRQMWECLPDDLKDCLTDENTSSM